jgi:acetyltransferase-like isoleucine patch superfamily enzyme
MWYPKYIKKMWWMFIVPFKLKRLGVTISRTAHFQGAPIVSMEIDSEIEIGDRCSLCSISESTALGVNHPIVLRTLRPGAFIKIGADTGISGGTICSAIGISIGAECLFGANVTVVDTDFHASHPENRRYNSNPSDIKCAHVVIEDNVFLGTGAIVMKGVTIGKNSIIAAGAVVSRNIPPNSIAAGNPAAVIKSLPNMQ